MRTIEIHDVPAELHAVLEARAAAAGQSLSDYLLAELRRLAARPSWEEMRSRLAGPAPISPRESPAAAVRAERRSR